MVVYGRGPRAWRRQYVEVLALHRLDGSMKPMRIHWLDGRNFDCELIKPSTRDVCTYTGGRALKFVVRIKGNERVLYYDEARWFVEVFDVED